MANHTLRKFPFGKVLISLSAAGTMVGSYVADWNKTHIHNPTWPPHAKFHNAQTMSMGAGTIPGSALPLVETRPVARVAGRPAIIASLYGLTQLSAALYPGTASVDPPREDNWPQLKYTLPSLGLVLPGDASERRRITRR